MRLRKITCRYSVFLPVARHGGWSKWSPHPIDHCRCSGKKLQTRSCNNPSPRCGGRSCPGGSTRNVNCNECSCNNGGCQHICHETDAGRTCSCLPGYKVSGTSCTGMWILRLNWGSDSGKKYNKLKTTERREKRVVLSLGSGFQK